MSGWTELRASLGQKNRPAGDVLPPIYHAFGIDPETIVYNLLNQPRELVKAKAVTKLFA